MLWKKNKPEQEDKMFKEIIALLEVTRIQLVEVTSRIDNLEAKYRGIDIKYGKLIKSITEEQEEEDLNSSEGSNYYGNPFSRN